MPKSRFSIFLATLAIAVTFESAFCTTRADAEDKIEIDFIEGKLNGTSIFALNLDALTDILGRPSSIISRDEISANGRVALIYCEKGLLFEFDREQRLASVEIFLLARGDSDSKEPHCAFSGKLNKDLNGNWKAKRLVKEFAEFDPKDMHANQPAVQRLDELEKRAVKGKNSVNTTERNLIAAAMPELLGLRYMLNSVEIARPEFKAQAHYEVNSKFLEDVVLIRQER